jgi:hypothetical protein
MCGAITYRTRKNSTASSPLHPTPWTLIEAGLSSKRTERSEEAEHCTFIVDEILILYRKSD